MKSWILMINSFIKHILIVSHYSRCLDISMYKTLWCLYSEDGDKCKNPNIYFI